MDANAKQTETVPPFAPPSGYATWECFRDESYYGMSCVRRIGERKFGQGFHANTLDEAKELTRILNDLESDKRRLDWIADTKNGYAALQLPGECVRRNLHSMRAAIDDAIEMQGRESHNEVAHPRVSGKETKE